jgi:hypothetical protein
MVSASRVLNYVARPRRAQVRPQSDGGFRRISVVNRPVALRYDAAMTSRRLAIVAAPLLVAAMRSWTHTERPPAQMAATVDATLHGTFARIAMLRPHDGDTVDFEAGYIRHLEFHRQAKDTWTWYGWTIWAGERQRWFVYATFGHSAASFDQPVSPADDERDNVANVTPHAEFVGSGVYEYLPSASRGTGQPQPAPRLEFTTVDLKQGAERAFEAALRAQQAGLQTETLWYRLIAGGATPRYVRLRPRPTVSSILEGSREQALSDAVNDLVVKTTIEILNLRPAMSYGLQSP